MSRNLIALVAVVLFVGGAGWFFMQKEAPTASTSTETLQSSEQASEVPIGTTETGTPAGTSGATPTPTAGSYTMAQVAAHGDDDSCWSVINGSVYDLTSWIAGHPGGMQAILGICGKDGSSVFNNQHGGREKQESQLATMKIGVLVQ